MTLRVIDVSAWQGFSVDWAALAQQGIAGGLAKAAEGTGYADPTFVRNWAAIKSAGLARGAYHFARPDLGTTPQAEAAFFLSQLPPLDAGDLLVCDLEVPTAGPGAFDAFALAFGAEVQGRTHTTPLLYTGRWYAQGLGRLSSAELAHLPLFDAAYGPSRPPPYAPWTKTTLWQHTDRAAYRGIAACDESLFDGSVDQLRALGYPAPRTQAPPPPLQQAKHWRLTTAMHLRPAPAREAVPLGPLLPVGTQVVEIGPHPGMPQQTDEWTWVRTSGDVQGYLLKANMVPYAP